MWRNVLLVKRYQIRGGFVQFLRLIRGCFGSVADSLPQIAWAAGFGHKQKNAITSDQVVVRILGATVAGLFAMMILTKQMACP
jgi:hypothetical protein